MYRQTLITTVLLAAVAGTVTAQTGPTWNRKVEAISVMPTPVEGEPEGWPVEIVALFSASASGTSAPLDLSTEVDILRNGTLIETLSIAIEASPAGFGCEGGCPPPLLCFVLEGVEIGCTDAVFASATTSASLQPGDELEVQLRPAPLAGVEPDEIDNQATWTFEGDPMYWNRRIDSVTISPSPADDSFFDVWIDTDLEANYSGVLDLSSEVELRVNGVSVETLPVPVSDWLFWDQCIDACGTACVMDASGETFGTCQEDEGAPVDCPCQYQPVPDIVFPGVSLTPEDVIVVILRPVPGALPELPGFGEDDEMGGELPGCPADFDGSGDVAFADLLAMLAEWGPCAGCPEDLDGSGDVGFADMLLLLAAWGPCAPV